MTKIKRDFLAKSVGFKKSDLSLNRQMELDAYASKHSFEWLMLALSRRPLEEWEQWGFVLFKKPEFIELVDGLVASFNKITDEQIKQDNERKATGKNKKKLTYRPEHLERNWKILKGNINTTWTYPVGFTSTGREILANASKKNSIDELDELERLAVVMGIQEYMEVRISPPKRR